MLTNQNTTQGNSKKCLKKGKRKYKFFSIITVIIALASMLCINASAIVLQDVTGINAVYPSLIMYIPSSNENSEASLVEVSGIGKEGQAAGYANISTDNGNIELMPSAQYYENQYTGGWVQVADYITSSNFTYLYSNKPLNINLWEWSAEYSDSIMWQLWRYEQANITARYDIEIPYFNNSLFMATDPVEIRIEKQIQHNPNYEGVYIYDIAIPNIDEIVEKTIEAIEGESQSGITFQYKGEELRENNYITNVYAEDGSKVNIDFKRALNTVLIDVRMSFNTNAAVPGINNIGIVNYNDYTVNDGISHLRTSDFRQLVIEGEFERSAEITLERKEKDVRLLNWLGNAIAGIMNVEIFPNFSLGALLSVIIMIPLILWILKLIAGG